MSETDILPENCNESGLYEIRLKGQLEDRWAGWFENVVITLEENGSTRLLCSLVDQAALHGLLKKVRDVGLPLLSINQVQLSEKEQI